MDLALLEKVVGELNRIRRSPEKPYLSAAGAKREALLPRHSVFERDLNLDGLPELALDLQQSESCDQHAEWLAKQHGKLRKSPKLASGISKWFGVSPPKYRPGWFELSVQDETKGDHERKVVELVNRFFSSDATGRNLKLLRTAREGVAVGIATRNFGRKRTRRKSIYLCVRLK